MSKTVLTVFREFNVAHEEDISKLNGTNGLKYMDFIRNLIKSNFSQEEVQKALSSDQRIATLIQDFIDQVKRETDTVIL